MSATRLMVLGVVRIHGTAHGYLVQNELLAWNAHEWANIKWGSLYHALKQMTKQGLLTAQDAGDGSWRVDYTITPAGDVEFLRLLRSALAHPEHRPDALAAALGFFTALPRAEVIELLRSRVAALESERDVKAKQSRQAAERPSQVGHISELFGLWVHAADSGIAWTRSLIDRLERGDWTMADDDPHAFGTPGSGRRGTT
ncbi:DNA-binding PadR family transcriptional regulator [Stackebrandtia albiflava]|uniref:DNA-binding PadR family transcriptional regulator n=1 Tax=Stackebrandtia albiflava TaxID=406432 RepID=A0A562VA57_9ACTN|nr:PadR family transcriptional regulator [Stackebrandtia albiflava]TWJ14780.1 DNA-binding PadR family transcriptional regulator [Stackebrandtia albiflava]